MACGVRERQRASFTRQDDARILEQYWHQRAQLHFAEAEWIWKCKFKKPITIAIIAVKCTVRYHAQLCAGWSYKRCTFAYLMRRCTLQGTILYTAISRRPGGLRGGEERKLHTGLFHLLLAPLCAYEELQKDSAYGNLSVGTPLWRMNYSLLSIPSISLLLPTHHAKRSLILQCHVQNRGLRMLSFLLSSRKPPSFPPRSQCLAPWTQRSHEPQQSPYSHGPVRMDPFRLKTLGSAPAALLLVVVVSERCALFSLTRPGPACTTARKSKSQQVAGTAVSGGGGLLWASRASQTLTKHYISPLAARPNSLWRLPSHCSGTQTGTG